MIEPTPTHYAVGLRIAIGYGYAFHGDKVEPGSMADEIARAIAQALAAETEVLLAVAKQLMNDLESERTRRVAAQEAITKEGGYLDCLQSLSDRHGWGPGMGPCVCEAHIKTAHLLANKSQKDGEK